VQETVCRLKKETSFGSDDSSRRIDDRFCPTGADGSRQMLRFMELLLASGGWATAALR